MNPIISLLRYVLSKAGLDIMKYPSSKFQTLPVFDLCIQFLMSVKGPNLSFIQVGANDGSLVDPLRKYILTYPWHGILVEPQPDVFERLRENYESVKDRLIFENVAIVEAASEITMYKAKSGYSGSAADPNAVVSVNPRTTAKQLGIKETELEQFTVQGTTLDKLAAKHNISDLDLLQIDVEGHDFAVLKTIDFSKIRPLVIQFEHAHIPFRDVDKAVQHLSRNGYRVLYGSRQYWDTLAIHETFPLPLP